MGYSFRQRLETSQNGEIAVIQMKDLGDNNTVACNDLVRINMKNMKQRHFVIKDDLIFRSRGQLNTTAILLKNPGMAVVAAPLLRIRVLEPNEVLPKYLNWYISQRDAQVFLTSRAKGTTQSMISKQTIEDLDLVLPSLDKQRLIVELATLSAQEQTLTHTLDNKRQQYISTVLMQFAKGE